MIEVAKTILDRVTNLRNRGRVGALGQFYCGGGNELLVANLDLGIESVVIDAGGYEGDWTDEMLCRYGLSSIIFEPNPHNAMLLRARYKANERVGVIEVALSNRSGTATFKQQGAGSTLALDGNVLVKLCDINKQFIPDCLKLNIEGEEYNVLERMLSTDRRRPRYILVQFHQSPNCNRRREKIQLDLSKTHTCVFDYPFVWELWKLKPSEHT